MGSEEIEKEQGGNKQLCKTVAQVAFSHIGLCLIVCLYCVLGGFLFELLEKENEVHVHRSIYVQVVLLAYCHSHLTGHLNFDKHYYIKITVL